MVKNLRVLQSTPLKRISSSKLLLTIMNTIIIYVVIAFIILLLLFKSTQFVGLTFYPLKKFLVLEISTYNQFWIKNYLYFRYYKMT